MKYLNNRFAKFLIGLVIGISAIFGAIAASAYIYNPTGSGGGGGTIGGTIDATQVAYGSALDTIQGDANFTRDLTSQDTTIGESFGTNKVGGFMTSSSSVAGLGFPGSLNLEVNQSTNENAFTGIVDLSGFGGQDYSAAIDHGLPNGDQASVVATSDGAGGNVLNIVSDNRTSSNVEADTQMTSTLFQSEFTNSSTGEKAVWDGNATESAIAYTPITGANSSGFRATNGCSGASEADVESNAVIWSFPCADGSNGEALVTDGSGHLNFAPGSSFLVTHPLHQIVFGDGSTPGDISSSDFEFNVSNGDFNVDHSGNNYLSISPSTGLNESGDNSANGSGTTWSVDYGNRVLLGSTVVGQATGTTFSGSGLNDGDYTGSYTGSLLNPTYRVTIDSTGNEKYHITSATGNPTLGDTITSSSGGSGTVTFWLVGSVGQGTLIIGNRTGTFNVSDTLASTGFTGTIGTDLGGQPDTFGWRDGVMNTRSYVPIVGSNQPQFLSFGISIGFSASTGHTFNDNWSPVFNTGNMNSIAVDYPNDAYCFGECSDLIHGDALNLPDGLRSIFLGSDAGFTVGNPYSMSQIDQVSIGTNAGNMASNAQGLVSIGVNAGQNATNAGGTTALGGFAGYGATNSSNAVFLGDGAGDGAPNAQNVIFIGDAAGASDTINTVNTGYSGILIGNFSSTGGNVNSVAIGTGATNTSDNQFLVSQPSSRFSNISLDGSLFQAGDYGLSHHGSFVQVDDRSSATTGTLSALTTCVGDCSGTGNSMTENIVDGSLRFYVGELGTNALDLNLNTGQYIFGNGTTVTANDTLKNITLNGSLVNQVQYATPSTGNTVTSNKSTQLILNPSGALLALTIVLPSSPVNGQQFNVASTQTITTVTYSGGTVIGNPTGIALGNPDRFVYSSDASEWIAN